LGDQVLDGLGEASAPRKKYRRAESDLFDEFGVTDPTAPRGRIPGVVLLWCHRPVTLRHASIGAQAPRFCTYICRLSESSRYRFRRVHAIATVRLRTGTTRGRTRRVFITRARATERLSRRRLQYETVATTSGRTSDRAASEIVRCRSSWLHDRPGAGRGRYRTAGPTTPDWIRSCCSSRGGRSNGAHGACPG
jgi:hypothetical protein